MFGGGYHELEAYESYDRAIESGYRPYKKYQRMEYDCGPPDANFYHGWIDIAGIKHETAKAYLITYLDMDIWIAKKLIREFKNDGKQMFVHMKIFTQLLQTEVEKLKAREKKDD